MAKAGKGMQRHEPPPASNAMTEAAALTSRLANALSAAGYAPQQIEVQVDRDRSGQLELRLLADVPGLSEAQLLALLVVDERPPPPALPAPPAGPKPREGLPGWLGRLMLGLVFGLLLGVVGLPGVGPPTRLPQTSPPDQPLANNLGEPNASESNSAVEAGTTPTPTPIVAPPPTPAPAVVAARPATGVLFAERLLEPLPGWPNDPQGTAWFGDGGFRLSTRQAGRFVAVGVPLGAPASDVVVTAHLRKLNGPNGGGYGIILRDQGPADARDGRSQDGQFLVLEVSDEGDVGIWQRDRSRWIDVLSWIHSEAVHVGSEPNELIARSIGSRLQLDVNGTRVADVTYTGLPPQGGVGIFAGGDLNEVVLDWLRIDAVAPTTAAQP
jgi:hypothetical protein